MDNLRRIIRRGNHFIYLREMGWVLIDGEWYQRLNSYNYGDRIAVPCYAPFSPTDTTDCSPIEPAPSPLVWERVKYQPSNYRPQFGRDKWFTAYLLAHVPSRTDPDNHLINILENRLAKKWYNRLRNNTKIGWRLLPDGKLPCFWNNPEWIERGQEDMFLRAG